GAAGLAAGAFLLAPMVVMQSTTQANDVAGGGLLMATIALACAPGATWPAGRLGWLGLGLGLTATTKLALLPCLPGVPRLVLAARRGRRQPIFLYGLVAAFMLPAWWMLTMHEPRFLLAFFGLGCAFLPWSLLAVPRPQRRMGSALLAGAAVFSALVTFDQGLLPLARQPGARAEFYDCVWGVDPLVTSLPEHEGLLHHTGYGPPSGDY